MASKYEETMKAKGFLSYYVDKLPPKLIQKAKDELGETDEVQSAALEQFRKCILADKKLKYITDDDFLMPYLRVRKYNVPNALDLLRNFLNLVISYPEMFDKLDKEKIKKLATCRFINPLPFRDNDGCLVVICQIRNWDPDEVNVQILFCTVAALIFGMVMNPVNQITGLRFIFDAKEYTFKQVRNFIPRYIPLISRALRNSLPFRFKSIHVVNEAVVMQYAWSVFKIFLSKKMKNRFRFHGDNMKDLHKFIPKEILPVEYGGDYPNCDNSDWLGKELDKFYDTFLRIIKTLFP